MSKAVQKLSPDQVPTLKLPKLRRPVFEVEVSVMSDSNFYAGLSGDATGGGLFYATYARLAIGAEIDVELALPGFGAPMFLSGRVVWTRDHSDDEPSGGGIAFESLSDAAREKIRSFSKLRPPLYFERTLAGP